jgi:hypothetical protein
MSVFGQRHTMGAVPLPVLSRLLEDAERAPQANGLMVRSCVVK